MDINLQEVTKMKRTKTPTPKTVNQINKTEILQMKRLAESAIVELSPHYENKSLPFSVVATVCQRAVQTPNIPKPIQKASLELWNWVVRTVFADFEHPELTEFWDMFHGITELSDGTITCKAWAGGILKTANLNRSN